MHDWRADELEYSDIWDYVLNHLERLYPGRFITIGDIDRTPDAEFLAMPKIGTKTLAMLRATVDHAKASPVPLREAHEQYIAMIERGDAKPN